MEKDISTLLLDSLSAAQSSSGLFFKDSKDFVLSGIKRSIRKIVFSLISYILVFISLVYLVIFGIGRGLDQLDVDPLYHGPIYAGVALFFGLGFFLFSGGKEEVEKKITRREDLKAIATFKQDLSELVTISKDILDNPVKYARDKSLKFIQNDLNLRQYSKYKTVLLLLGLSILLIAVRFSFLKIPNMSRRIGVAGRRMKLERLPIWEPIKGVLLTLVVGIVKDFLEKSLTKPQKVPVKTSY